MSIADNSELGKGSVEKSPSNQRVPMSAFSGKIDMAEFEAQADKVAEEMKVYDEPKTGGFQWGEVSESDESIVSRAAVEGIRQSNLRVAEKYDMDAVEIRNAEPDLVKRVKSLRGRGVTCGFHDTRPGPMGLIAKSTDRNRKAVMNYLFEGADLYPHRDTFRGRIVDHNDVIVDDHYYSLPLVDAFAEAGLNEQAAKSLREFVAEWAKGKPQNDLIERLKVKIPEWDHVPRMREFLIKTFECAQTDLNRAFSEYFSLSLYSRLMRPGSRAPMVLSIFGTQGCGKSFFGTQLCRIIMGDGKADTVQLNLDGEKMEFLRQITGNSIIAAVGEMLGFTRGDLNKIKDFITRCSDKMHYKFEGHFDQQRQFIIVLDGNKYEGLMRDETGNRRFYPIFAGQLPDRDGKPQWKMEGFNRGPHIASQEFEDEVWQILAEARDWIEKKGPKAYDDLVDGVEKKVFAFSQEQMRMESGTILDETIDTYLDAALKKVAPAPVKKRDGSGGGVVYVDRIELLKTIDEVAGGRRVDVNIRGLNKAMAARGGIDTKRNGERSYRFDECADAEAFREMLKARNPDDGEFDPNDDPPM